MLIVVLLQVSNMCLTYSWFHPAVFITSAKEPVSLSGHRLTMRLKYCYYQGMSSPPMSAAAGLPPLAGARYPPPPPP